ncbi:MAG: PAS domain-containing protein, partial [Pseudomonadota bacterium]
MEHLKNQHLFERAVEQAYDAVLITTAGLDAPGPAIVYVNDAFCRTTGYSRAELLGATPRILQGPRTERAVLDRLRTNLEAGDPFEGSTINYRKDGTPYVVRWSISPLRDANGEIEYFVSVQRDISHETRLEHFSETLLSSLGEGVFGIDAEGRFTFLNPMACRLLGFTDPGQALGRHSRTTSLHSHPDGTPYLEQECPINAVLQTGEPVEAWEDTFWSRDGQSFPVQVYAAPVHGMDGELTGAVISFQDISGRVEARRERDRIREIMEASPDFVGMTDLDGNVLYQNPALMEVIGPLEQLVYRAIHPDWASRKLTEEAIPTAAREGIWWGDSALLAPDGREIPVSQTVVAHTGPDGQVNRFSTIMRDMSEQRQLEEQLRTEKELSDAILRNLPGVFY